MCDVYGRNDMAMQWVRKLIYMWQVTWESDTHSEKKIMEIVEDFDEKKLQQQR